MSSSNSSKLTELLIKLRGIREQSSEYSVSMTLPIKEIDGVCRLDCKLTGYVNSDSAHEYFAFEVNTKFNAPMPLFRFEKMSNSEEDKLTKEEIGEFAVKLLDEVLPNLKLRRNGKMNFEKDGEDAVVGEIKNLFGEIEMPNLIIDKCECVVCYEKTQTKTDCEHSLCYRCWSKLKEVDGSLPCPICREAIWCAKELDE
jgi:hypothetical protein